MQEESKASKDAIPAALAIKRIAAGKGIKDLEPIGEIRLSANSGLRMEGNFTLPVVPSTRENGLKI